MPAFEGDCLVGLFWFWHNHNFGYVFTARVVADRYTDRSKGFGFVSFSDPGVAIKARFAMDGQVGAFSCFY